MSLPSNHNKPWSMDDRACVKRLFLEGASVAYIADHLGRTHLAINIKLREAGLVDEDYDPIPQANNQTKAQHQIAHGVWPDDFLVLYGWVHQIPC